MAMGSGLGMASLKDKTFWRTAGFEDGRDKDLTQKGAKGRHGNLAAGVPRGTFICGQLRNVESAVFCGNLPAAFRTSHIRWWSGGGGRPDVRRGTSGSRRA